MKFLSLILWRGQLTIEMIYFPRNLKSKIAQNIEEDGQENNELYHNRFHFTFLFRFNHESGN